MISTTSRMNTSVPIPMYMTLPPPVVVAGIQPEGSTHDSWRIDEIGDVVDEGLQEHHVVRVLMREISRLRPGDDSWVAKMTVLIENVTHHADEEERELFSSSRRRYARPLDPGAVETARTDWRPYTQQKVAQ